MTGAKMGILIDILEEHLEELGFLWSQRQSALTSTEFPVRALVELEDRIEARVQGLLVGGSDAQPLLIAGLESDDPSESFAAGYVMLRSGHHQPVIEAFRAAAGGRLDGLVQALGQAPGSHATELVPLLETDGPHAVATAEVLALQGSPEVRRWRAEAALANPNPAVRSAAWRVVARGAACGNSYFEQGSRDPDPSVAFSALEAAAWRGQPGVLPYCRTIAERPIPDTLPALNLFAMLAAPADLPVIRSICEASPLGARRFEVAAFAGHPALVDILIPAMSDPDPRTAAAAGEAFARITGFDVSSNRRVTLAPEDGHEPDEFEAEFLDEARLPDAEKARAIWASERSRFARSTRWCRGVDLTSTAGGEAFAEVDLASLRATILRSTFEGRRNGSPLDLERFAPTSIARPG